MSVDATTIERWQREGLISGEQAVALRADLAKRRGNAGAAMLMAAALVNGAVLWLFTRVYGVDIAVHAILALWLVCVVPLAYATRAKAVAAACGLLFCAWVAAFAFRGLSAFSVVDRWSWLSPLVLLGGVCAFALGGLHYLVPGFDGVARGIRLASLQAALVALFTMTFELVASGAAFYDELRDPEASSQVAVAATSFAVIALAATIAGQALERVRARITRVEAPVNVALLVTAVIFVLVPIPARTSALLASVVLVGMVVSVLVVGVRRRDKRLIRISGVALSVFFALRVGAWLWGTQGMVVAIAVGAAVAVVGAALTHLAARRGSAGARA